MDAKPVTVGVVTWVHLGRAWAQSEPRRPQTEGLNLAVLRTRAESPLRRLTGRRTVWRRVQGVGRGPQLRVSGAVIDGSSLGTDNRPPTTTTPRPLRR